jgi:hypothetical protein
MARILLAAVVMTFVFASCNKCYECSVGNDAPEKFCRKDYIGDKSLFEDYIKELEKANYRCVKVD